MKTVARLIGDSNQWIQYQVLHGLIISPQKAISDDHEFGLKM